MKKILFAVSAVALALSAGSAMAADLPSRKEAPVYVPPPPPPPMWTGFYAGLNIGGGWDANSGTSGASAYYDPNFPIASSPSTWVKPTPGNIAVGPNLFYLPNGSTLGNAGGVLGGAQVGYNFQFNQFVLGVEADFQGTSISGNGSNSAQTLFPTPYSYSGSGNSYLTPLGLVTGANVNLSWFGTVRGRVGYLITPTLLIYGTGGFAYGQVDAWGFSTTPTGWTAGGGVEWLFAPHWSAKVEYLYVDLSNCANNGGWNIGQSFSPQINVVRAGINYHFNFAAPAPVVAKY
jgi:outer membrane immunogenic protein